MMSNFVRSCLSTAVAIPLIVGSIGCSTPKVNTEKKESVDSKATSDSDSIWARGELQPTSKIVRIGSAPGDRIEEIFVQIGEQVTKGKQLVRLASERIRDQELQIARQRLEETKSQLTAKRIEADLQVQLAEAQLRQLIEQEKQAMAQVKATDESDDAIQLASKQVDRLTELTRDPLTKPLVGTIELEQKRIDLSQISTKQKLAKLAAEQMNDVAMSSIGMAKEKVDAAKKSRDLVDSLLPIRSLEMQIELLERQLAQLQVKAPSAGTILSLSCAVGEGVTNFPLMEMADLSRMSCVAEIQETQIRRLRIGQKAVIKSTAMQRPLAGTVARIHQMVGPPQMRLPNPMAKSDFRSVPVWIEIDSADVGEAAKLVQLQVDVTITAAP